MQKKRIDWGFKLLFAMVYLAFMVIDWGGFSLLPLGHVLKYSVVLMCVAYVWIVSKDIFLQLALTFTALADFFLLWGGNYWQYNVGMCVFSLVQLLHAFRLEPKDKIRTAIWYCLFAATGLVGFSVATLFMAPQPELIGLSTCYAFLLLRNTVLAFRMLKNEDIAAPMPLFVVVGMLLFVACDVNVLLYNIGGYLGFSEKGLFIVGNLMWTFYAPSQYLLARSAQNIRKRLAFSL